MTIMYNGSVTEKRKDIVQTVIGMYEKGKLLTYFDMNKVQFDIPLAYFRTFMSKVIGRTDYSEVTELDLFNVYGIKGLYARIKELDDDGDYSSETTYQELAYVFDKETERRIYNSVMLELNMYIQDVRENKLHVISDLQSYVGLLSDIDNAIHKLYDKYPYIPFNG